MGVGGGGGDKIRIETQSIREDFIIPPTDHHV